MKVLCGFSFRIWWRMPSSVATMNSCTLLSRANRRMLLVEPTKSAWRRTAASHSGCARTSASGCWARMSFSVCGSAASSSWVRSLPARQAPSESELAQRFIASQASIRGDDLRKGKVPPEVVLQRVGREGGLLDADAELVHLPRQLSHDLELEYSLEDGRYNASLTLSNLTDAALYDNFRIQRPGRAVYVKVRYFIN